MSTGPTLRAEAFFVSLSEKEKRWHCLNHVKSLKSPQPGLVNLVFPRQTGFIECEHPFIDKPMVINEPSVASARFLSLGPKLYLSNMPRMLNKDLTSIHAGSFSTVTPK